VSTRALVTLWPLRPRAYGPWRVETDRALVERSRRQATRLVEEGWRGSGGNWSRASFFAGKLEWSLNWSDSELEVTWLGVGGKHAPAAVRYGRSRPRM
jgi:hypothetical protein